MSGQEDSEYLRLWQQAPRAPQERTACPGAQLLAAYADRHASPAQVEQVEHHLLDCAACLEALKDVRVMLQSGAAQAPDDWRAQAQDLVPTPAVEWSIRRPFRFALWPSPAWIAGTAAVMLTCSVLGYRLGQSTGLEGQLITQALTTEISLGWNGDLLGGMP